MCADLCMNNGIHAFFTVLNMHILKLDKSLKTFGQTSFLVLFTCGGGGVNETINKCPYFLRLAVILL